MSRAKEKAYIITERRLNDLAVIIAFHAALLRIFELSLEEKRQHTR